MVLCVICVFWGYPVVVSTYSSPLRWGPKGSSYKWSYYV